MSHGRRVSTEALWVARAGREQRRYTSKVRALAGARKALRRGARYVVVRHERTGETYFVDDVEAIFLGNFSMKVKR